jgi:para-nitrobenzyl esterase
MPFVFNNVAGARSLTGAGPEAMRLAEEMSEAWVSFAAGGDPNSPKSGLPHWSAYQPGTRATMLFDTTNRVANDPARDARLALNEALASI